jgi:hypothetical protein
MAMSTLSSSGESIDIASGTVSVNWDTGAWLIRAEGPLGIWLEVKSKATSPYFSIDGGMGLFDAIFDAIGDAAEAVGQAFVDAANAVADAFEDLGNAILDFGQDILDFASGLISDIADVFDDVFDAISSAFDSSRTVVEPVGRGRDDDLLWEEPDRRDPDDYQPEQPRNWLSPRSSTRSATSPTSSSMRPTSLSPTLVAQSKYQERSFSTSDGRGNGAGPRGTPSLRRTSTGM